MARNTVDVEEFVSYFPHFRGVFQLYNDVYLKKKSALRAEFQGFTEFWGFTGISEIRGNL